MMPSAEILLAMMVWISSITSLPVAPMPPIQYSDGKTMKLMLYGCEETPPNDVDICKNIQDMDINDTKDNNTLGLYDHHNHGIHLNPSLKKMHPVVINSVIIHELVHAMQFSAKVPYRCFGELEELAYEIQNRYLKKNGRQDVFHELEVSPFFLFLIFSCDKGDVYGGPRLDGNDS